MYDIDIPEAFSEGVLFPAGGKLPPLVSVLVVMASIEDKNYDPVPLPVIQANIYETKKRCCVTCRVESNDGRVVYGFGKCTGMGVDRASMALSSAIRSTGIRLGDKDFAGQGLNRAVNVLEEVADKLGYSGIKGYVFTK